MKKEALLFHFTKVFFFRFEVNQIYILCCTIPSANPTLENTKDIWKLASVQSIWQRLRAPDWGGGARQTVSPFSLEWCSHHRKYSGQTDGIVPEQEEFQLSSKYTSHTLFHKGVGYVKQSAVLVCTQCLLLTQRLGNEVYSDPA